MTVFVVETYVVKPEKQAAFKSLLKKFLKFMKDNPALVKEMKSWKLFTQTIGSLSGAYVEMIECGSLAEYERSHAKLMKSKEFMKIYNEAMTCIDTTTFSTSVWESVA